MNKPTKTLITRATRRMLELGLSEEAILKTFALYDGWTISRTLSCFKDKNFFSPTYFFHVLDGVSGKHAAAYKDLGTIWKRIVI